MLAPFLLSPRIAPNYRHTESHMSASQDRAEIQHIAQALQLAEHADDLPQQIELYERLLDITPQVALIHAKIAHLHLRLKQVDSAQPYIHQALSMPGDDQVDAELFEHMAECPELAADLEQARAWYRQRPNLWRFKLYSSALTNAQLHAEAERLYLDVLQTPLAVSQQVWILCALSKLYYDTGRYHDCIACCQLGLEGSPDDPRLHFNMATSLEQVARYEEAFQHYAIVLRSDPQHIGTHNNLGLLMLRLKQFEVGWSHYEWRWLASQQNQQQYFNTPQWQGESLKGKSLLIWAEQGIGDHIMFASMLPDLLELEGKVHFETYARLDPILERSFPEVAFIRREQTGNVLDGVQMLYRQSWPQSDYQIPMGSLGRLLRPDLGSFAGPGKFLRADEEASRCKREEYTRLFPGKKLIGLAWKGGSNISNDIQSRRIAMNELARLASQNHVQFINLQYGDTSAERAEAKALGLYIHHDENVNPLVNMDAQASQLAALDAVLSIDNTAVHLAGALGVPTYVLLQLNPNWRWGLEEGPSYWYPSVYLIRNREIGRWEMALDRAVAAMRDNGHL
ncbi:protein FlbA [Pseudomonas sp. NBRC 100443]|nr:protein FlbA [Pseudomonas sp. NBRC 100443]